MGQKWVCRHWLEAAQKWVQSGFRGLFHKIGPETHFAPTFGPLPANDEKPIFDQLLCQINCLTILALRDLRPIVSGGVVPILEASEGVRSLFFMYGHFLVTFSEACATFFVTFCQASFAGLLLLQAETGVLHACAQNSAFFCAFLRMLALLSAFLCVF